jgi:hypothetical protein
MLHDAIPFRPLDIWKGDCQIYLGYVSVGRVKAVSDGRQAIENCAAESTWDHSEQKEDEPG